MPSGLRRFQESGQAHFVTFCCYRRRESFAAASAKCIFEAALEQVHLLLSEPQRSTIADAVKSLKQGVSRRLIGEAEHFWQKRYYDFNVRDYRQHVEKLRYIHRNPVHRGLCKRPEDWEWSSFRQYATGCEGRVDIECEWTARKRERALGRLSPMLPLPHSRQNKA